MSRRCGCYSPRSQAAVPFATRPLVLTPNRINNRNIDMTTLTTSMLLDKWAQSSIKCPFTVLNCLVSYAFTVHKPDLKTPYNMTWTYNYYSNLSVCWIGCMFRFLALQTHFVKLYGYITDRSVTIWAFWTHFSRNCNYQTTLFTRFFSRNKLSLRFQWALSWQVVLDCCLSYSRSRSGGNLGRHVAETALPLFFRDTVKFYFQFYLVQ